MIDLSHRATVAAAGIARDGDSGLERAERVVGSRE
jgi:hypothetical protein